MQSEFIRILRHRYHPLIWRPTPTLEDTGTTSSQQTRPGLENRDALRLQGGAEVAHWQGGGGCGGYSVLMATCHSCHDDAAEEA